MAGVKTSVGLLTSFYHNSAPVNKKIHGVLGDNFIDAEAELLFTVRIVLGKSGVTDLSIPYESGGLNLSFCPAVYQEY